MTALIRSNLLDQFMKPNREDVFHPFQQLFDKFYDEFFSGFSSESLKSKAGFPRWDVYESDGKWVVEVWATGCRPEDISVEILPLDTNDLRSGGNKRVLKISGRVSVDHQLKEVTYHVRELRRSAFERSIYLPNNVDGDPEASMKDGVLRLSWDLPKTPQESGVKRIEVKKLD